jgi:hypothetical protein
MAKDTTKVTLGSGDLYLNNIDVGHLKGDVEFVFELEKVEFKPANMLGPVKLFLIGESATLKASLAEIKCANFRLAMGLDQALDANTSFPAYDPSSYVVPSGASYDIMTFGGAKDPLEVPLRFEHTKPDGDTIIVVMYNVTTETGLNIPFRELDISLSDVTFKGLSDASRTAGDQVGFLAEQTA